MVQTEKWIMIYMDNPSRRYVNTCNHETDTRHSDFLNPTLHVYEAIQSSQLCFVFDEQAVIFTTVSSSEFHLWFLKTATASFMRNIILVSHGWFYFHRNSFKKEKKNKEEKAIKTRNIQPETSTWWIIIWRKFRYTAHSNACETDIELNTSRTRLVNLEDQLLF